MLKLLVFAGAVILGVTPPSPVAADEPLTGPELMELFPGTFRAVIQGKYEARVTVKSGGAIVGEITGVQEQGRWSVRDDKFCIVMPSMTRGRLECTPVIADGSWYRGRNVVFRRL